MMSDYERIAEIKAELAYLDTHQYLLTTYKEKECELAKQKEELEKKLQKEEQDVERLEETTILSLFYQLVGNKEEKLEKEKQEAMQASIEYHRVAYEYGTLVAQYKKLKERYEQKEALKDELEHLQFAHSSLSLVEKHNFQMKKNVFESQKVELKEIGVSKFWRGLPK